MKNSFVKASSWLILLFCFTSLISCHQGNSGDWKVEKINLFPFKQNDLYGYVDVQGKVVIPFRYTEATLFRNGRALVKYEDENEEEVFGYIKEDGSLSSGGYLTATIYCDGYAITSRKDEALSIIDVDGKVKATLDKADLYGWNEGTGKEEHMSISRNIRPLRATPFRSGVSIARLSQRESCLIPIDYKGKLIRVPKGYEIPKDASFVEGYCPLVHKETKHLAIMDTKGRLMYNKNGGELISSDKIKEIKILTPSSKGFLFRQDNKWGMMNWDGDIVINPQFEQMKQDGSLFVVRNSGKYGWCDAKGHFVINPQYESVGAFNEGDLAAAKLGKDDEYGYIDKEGKQIINPQFSIALPFENNLAIVQVGRDWGLINKEGRYITNPQFELILPFGNNEATIVCGSDHKCGLLDRSGNLIVNPIYDDASEDCALQNYSEYSTAIYTSSTMRKFLIAQSDYFNAEEVTELIVKIANAIPFGMDAKSLMKKYNLDRNDFKIDAVELQATSDDRFDYHLYALADFYAKVSDGWFGYTNKFKEDVIPNRYEIKINVYSHLTNNEKRVTNLRKALHNMFEKENAKLSTKGYQIRLSGEDYDRFIILIEPKEDAL